MPLTRTLPPARAKPRARTRSAARAQWLLLTALYLTVLEGAFRKWVVGDSTHPLSYAAFLSKDLALLAIILWCREGKPSRPTRLLRSITWAGVGLVLVGAALSATIAFSPAGAFLSFRSMIFLPALVPLLARRLQDVDLGWVALRVGWLAIPVAILGVFQFYLSPGHVLNRYVDGDPGITGMGHVRATGTFSFISGMGHFCLVTIWASLSLGALRPRAPRFRFALVVMAAGFLCALTCLSRAPALIAIGLIVAGLLVARLDVRLLLAIFLIVGVSRWLEAPPEDGDESTSLVTALVERHRSSEADSVTERLVSMVTQPLDAMWRFPTGGGFGIGQVGGYAVEGGVRRLTRYESEPARIALETGWMGLVGTLILRLGAVYALLLHGLRRPPGEARERALITGLSGSVFFAGNIAFDHVAGAFSAVLLALAYAQLDRSGQNERSR